MLELMRKAGGHIVEARRAITTRRSRVAILLRVGICVWCVVEVPLTADTARLLGAPHLLLARGVGEWLWKGGRRGRELSSLLGGEICSVIVAEVELKAVGVPAVMLLLLLLRRTRLLLLLVLPLLVCHLGTGL